MASGLGLSKDLDWFTEGTVPGRRLGNVFHGFRIAALRAHLRTSFQEVIIFDNPVYGVVLVLDGIVQLSTFDERLYHEMLVHPIMLRHDNPKRILIVGGGDGGVLRECLRHEPDEVVMIDIDDQLVSLCREHLPSVSDNAFMDPRLTLLFEDASVAVGRYDRHFDVAIIDGSDAIGPSTPLFDRPFYADVARAVKPDGLVAIQGGSFLDPEFLVKLERRAKASLHHVAPIRLTVPCYHCGEYCFFLAGQNEFAVAATSSDLDRRIGERGLNGRLQWYSPAFEQAAQCIPRAFRLR